MKKVFIIFFLLSSVAFSQGKKTSSIFNYYYGRPVLKSLSWVASFPGHDTSKISPWTASYLYFDGSVRGPFIRHLGDANAQYNLSIPAATKDTVEIIITMYNDGTTGRIVMGKNGSWYFGIGVNAGAWFVEA